MATPAFNLALNDILKVRVCAYRGDQISLNVLGYKVTAIVGASITGLECAGGLDNLFAPDYINLMSQFATYYGTAVSRLAPSSTLEAVSILNTAAGALLENCQPRQVTGMFTKQSATPGPAGRGRVYVPFPGAGQNGANGLPTAGYMTLLGILAGNLVQVRTIVGGAGSAQLQPVILKRASYPASPFWIASTARAKWATQRRRGSYGRTNALPF